MVILSIIGITAAVTCVGTFFLFGPSSHGGQHSAAESTATASVYNKNTVHIQQESIKIVEIIIIILLLVLIVSGLKQKLKKWYDGQQQQLPLVLSSEQDTPAPQPQTSVAINV